MPQMSPMMWTFLYIYVLMIYLMFMIIINYLLMMKFMEIKKSFFIKYNLNLLW